MNAARLMAWERVARQRRGDFWLWAWATVAGLAGAAGLWAIERAHGAGEARAWWVIGGCMAFAAIVMRAPFRLFWRPDATLLARLPIPGAALYRLALARSVRAGLQVGLLVAIAALPRAAADGWEVWARMAGLALGVGLVGGVLAPPVGVVAGLMVTSENVARAVATSVGGEVGAPPVIWLSILPALGGLAVGVVAWLLGPWATAGATSGGAGPMWMIAAGAGVAAVAAAMGGAPLASITLSGATREIAALDAVKLAHVDLDRARGLEGVWGRVLAGAGVAGAMYRKDVALARRRHPMYFILGGLGLLVLWIIAAAAGEATRADWTVGVAAALAGYLAVMGWRLARPDLERPRLLATLPIASGAAARGKIAMLGWRAVLIGAAAAPAIVRASAPMEIAMTVAGLVAAALLVGSVVATARR